ncbi:MAG: HEAT repeat domain-containing protein [Flagellimonas sp.]
MECEDIDKNIVDYIECDLTPQEMKLIAAHLDNCERCRGVMQQTRELLSMFETLPEVKMSRKLEGRLDAMVTDERRAIVKTNTLKPRNHRLNPILKVAATLLLVITSYFMGSYISEQESQNEILGLEQALIISKLKSDSPSERVTALKNALKMESMTPKMINGLKERILYDENVNVRLATVLAITNLEEPDAFTSELIEAVLMEKNPSVQIEIANALANIGDTTAVDPLKKLVENEQTFPFVKSEVSYRIAQLDRRN